ncbi:MAG: pyridoxal phosphate-dependent aminotransferase [Ardenticatenaceae bacterium]|nr:pyridoxal phosphate-dependent aminotransferase [Ardenticatenaceae bacterium]
MTFDFDSEMNRLGTHSVKWEFLFDKGRPQYGDHADPKHGRNRILPLWVADMDFCSPPAVVEALVARAQHGIFGYTAPADSYYEAVIGWMARRYGRTVERDWLVLTPGVVPAINMLVETFISPGEKVLVQRPVYYPFFSAVENNGGEIVSNSLVYADGRYTMNFDDLAQKAADPAVKMAILCSPHNPVGRVWSREELTRFGEICLANDVMVISDEIHCDLIHSGHTFTSFGSISDEFAENSIVCTAPSKTFNLAGLKTSNLVIPREDWRKPYLKTLMRHGLMGTNAFGVVATETAYNEGEAWLTAVMAYIEENYRFMVDYLAEHLPQLKVVPTEGTYLVWVDCRALRLDPAARKELIMGKAKLYLDEGEMFGAEGEGFERFNIACPRHILAEALERLREVISGQ